MASPEQIQKIKRLAKNGESANTIKEKLEIPKSTVYYHFKKEVGQKQKEKALKIPENEELKEEICGIFAGDGNFYKEKNQQYRIRFYFNYHEKYWEVLADFLEEKLERRPRIYKYPDKGRVEFDYSSKPLYKLLKENLDWGTDKTETIRLKEDKEFCEDFQRGFIRGLLDTDGHREKKFRRFIYGTISVSLRNNFSKILEDFIIEHTNYREEPKEEHWRTMHKLWISGDEAEIFQRKISPRNPKKQYREF